VDDLNPLPRSGPLMTRITAFFIAGDGRGDEKITRIAPAKNAHGPECSSWAMAIDR